MAVCIPMLVANDLHESPKSAVVEDDQLQNVFFRFVDGKTFCLLIHPLLDDVASIKRRLMQASYSTSPSMFRSQDFFLIWNGKPLDDENSLVDYGISKYQQPTIFVNYRLRGGCFIVSFTILVIIISAVLGSVCTCGLSLVVVPLLMPLLFVLPLFCL